MSKMNDDTPVKSTASIDERVRKLEQWRDYVLGGATVGALLITGYFGFASFFQIPYTVRSLLPEEIKKYVEQNLPGLEEDLSKFRANANSASTEAKQSAAKAADNAASVRDLLSQLRADPKFLRITSGEQEISHTTHPDIRRTNYCREGPDNERGAIDQRVNFENPFQQIPTVLVSLNAIDHVITGRHNNITGKINNLRIRAVVTSVDPNGFNYNLNTWCFTDLNWARMSWIAYGN